MNFSEFIGTSELQRAAAADQILQEVCLDQYGTASTREDSAQLSQLIEQIYENNDIEGMNQDDILRFIAACLYFDEQSVKERALLTLYYLLQARGNPEELAFLEEYCRDVLQEQNEKLRGRKHWVRLQLLLGAPDSNKRIEAYVQNLRNEETSPYAWERIVAVLQSWSESFRIYPEIETWGIPIDRSSEPYWALVRNTTSRHVKALRALQYSWNGLDQWLIAAVQSEFPPERLEWVFENFAVAGLDFPGKHTDFSTLYMQSDTHGRMVLLSYLGAFLAKGKWQSSSAVRVVLEPITSASEQFYERVVAQLLHAYSFLQNERPDSPFQRMLSLLNTPFPSPYGTPPVYHAVTGVCSPILLHLLVEQRVQQEQLRNVSSLLTHSSEYVRSLGATLILQATRSGYSIAPFLPEIKHTLEQGPESSNGLASGKDIEPDEYELNFEFPALKPFIEAISAEQEAYDSFFNLSSLTGLLEACKPPLTAYRLARALREYAEAQGDN